MFKFKLENCAIQPVKHRKRLITWSAARPRKWK